MYSPDRRHRVMNNRHWEDGKTESNIVEFPPRLEGELNEFEMEVSDMRTGKIISLYREPIDLQQKRLERRAKNNHINGI